MKLVKLRSLEHGSYLPKSHNIIPCSTVLKEKCGLDGKIMLYWAHIIVGGHRQVEGVDYSKVFLSATKMPTVHVIMVNTVTQDWDIKSTYLNEMLKEMIYMKPP